MSHSIGQCNAERERGSGTGRESRNSPGWIDFKIVRMARHFAGGFRLIFPARSAIHALSQNQNPAAPMIEVRSEAA